MLRDFQDNFILEETTSSKFSWVTTSTQQLLVRSSHFFRAATFLRSSFFRTVTSSKQLFYQNSNFFRPKDTPIRDFLRIRNSSGQLPFGTTAFLVKDLFRIKISIEELLFSSSYTCTSSTFSEEVHIGKW